MFCSLGVSGLYIFFFGLKKTMLEHARKTHNSKILKIRMTCGLSHV